jgi:hypothetical protein
VEHDGERSSRRPGEPAVSFGEDVSDGIHGITWRRLSSTPTMGFRLLPFPTDHDVQCNTLWAMTDFTEENGARG